MPFTASPKIAHAAALPLKHAASHGAGVRSLQPAATSARDSERGFWAAQPTTVATSAIRLTRLLLLCSASRATGP